MNVELITDGKVHIVVVDGDAKLRHSADGTWGSSEAGWAIHPALYRRHERNHGRVDNSFGENGERLDHDSA